MADQIQKKGSDELLNAHTHLWHHILRQVDSMSLKCAIELGISDAIHNHGGPTTLLDLLSALSISHAKAPNLRRLMSKLVQSGIFALTKQGLEDAYSLTPLSTLLVTSNELCHSQFLLSAIHTYVLNSFMSMSAWFKNDDGPAPFSFVHGCGFWDMTSNDPNFNKVFNDGMASDARFLIRLLLKECGHVFQGITSLVDVGGGTGSAATAIAMAFPDVKCSVLDLPQVVHNSMMEKKGSVDFIVGDMFDCIPPADAIMLKWILHDWNDEECVKILQNCKKAIPSKEAGGKVIIIDSVVSSDNSLPMSYDTQLSFDMMMMVMLGGAERSEKEWKKIFFDAGFTDYKITPALGVRSVIELYP